MSDIKSEVTNDLRDEMREMAMDAARSAETMVEMREVVVEANAELTDRAFILLGMIAGIQMCMDEIEDEFDRNLEDFENPRRFLHDEGLVEERKHSAAEAARIMHGIDTELGDEMVERLHEADDE